MNVTNLDGETLDSATLQWDEDGGRDHGALICPSPLFRARQAYDAAHGRNAAIANRLSAIADRRRRLIIDRSLFGTANRPSWATQDEVIAAVAAIDAEATALTAERTALETEQAGLGLQALADALAARQAEADSRNGDYEGWTA